MGTSRHTWTDDQFKDAVSKNRTIKKICAYLNVPFGCAKRVRRDLHRLGLHAAFIENSVAKNKKKPVEFFLVKSTKRLVNSSYIKKKLIKDGYLKHECALCGIPPLWQGQFLYLQLDHINGDNTDHRLENLRLLCANCHSQTSTFCGKNTKRRWTRNCLECFAVISKSYVRCQTCSFAFRKREVVKNIPDTKTLYEELIKSSGVSLGRKYGKRKAVLFKLLEQDGYNVDIYKPKYR